MLAQAVCIHKHTFSFLHSLLFTHFGGTEEAYFYIQDGEMGGIVRPWPPGQTWSIICRILVRTCLWLLCKWWNHFPSFLVLNVFHAVSLNREKWQMMTKSDIFWPHFHNLRPHDSKHHQKVSLLTTFIYQFTYKILAGRQGRSGLDKLMLIEG